MVEWYNLLFPETRAYIRKVGFKPIIGLLLEKFTNASLRDSLWLALASKGPSSIWSTCQASSYVLTCWGGSTPLRAFIISTWCQIACFSHKGLQRSVSVWLGLLASLVEGLPLCQWWANCVSEVVDPLSGFWRGMEG